ncbi:MAG: DNA topoisomerase, partial [Chloroflexota bacterium]|nr:DNA topoisomerase [Chloroflexota bacterium]
MVTKLVIVESPAKARTLSKILGRSYHVKASIGHVRDLPKSQLGVDTDNFSPKYSIPQGKRKIVKEIRDLADKSSTVYLATDPDREGEAISWHLSQVINQKKDRETPIHRVTFHEITSEAVKQAFQNTRDIDMKLVYAQQARRILDRLVGYKLSPLLWHKVQKGLSAGRVQSVAVKIIVDREQEIRDFLPTEYWVIEVELARPRKKGDSFTATLTGLADGSRVEISSQDKADEIAACLEQAKYTVTSAKARQIFHQPSPPFITSTLQQEAWRKLHFSARQTMRIAQQLFEGLPVDGEGPTGLITY